jgi:type III secretory pathway component EscV
VIVLIALIPGIGTWVYALLTAWVALVFLVGALTGRRANDDNGRGATMEPQAA